MNYSKTKFSLNIQSATSQRSIPVKLNDTARRLCITLNDGGIPYHLHDGCRAVFFAKKPDGSEIVNDCIIENCLVVIYDFTPNTTSVRGTLKCELRIYGEDGLLISSPKFVMVVDSRVNIDQTNHLSESEYTAWDNIFLTEQQRVVAEQNRNESFEEAIENTFKAAQNANLIASSISTLLEAGEFNGKDGVDGLNGKDGVDGKDGKDGKDGLTPFIGANGNWWIGNTDTGRPSCGSDGKNGSDYILTAADKREIAATVLGQFPIAEDISV